MNLNPRRHVEHRCQQRVRRYFEQLGSDDPLNLHRSLKATVEQVVREYEHRSVIELIQNGHDAIPRDDRSGTVKLSLDLDECEFGVLYVANTGRPFSAENFDAICDVGRSDKGVDEGIGNKGIGFKSVLELCNHPQVFSRMSITPEPSDSFDGFCFTFAGDDDYLRIAEGDQERAEALAADFFRLLLPVWLEEQGLHVREFAAAGFSSLIRLELKSVDAQAEVQNQLAGLADTSAPLLLFLRRLTEVIVETRERGESSFEVQSRSEEPMVPTAVGDVARVTVSDVGDFLVLDRSVDEVAFLGAIKSSIASGRISDRWESWRGDARVEVAIPLDPAEFAGRLYTHLPMGGSAKAPIPAHVNAPFFAKLARVDLESSVPVNDLLFDAIAQLCVATAALISDGESSLPRTLGAALLAWDAALVDRLMAAGETLDVDLVHSPLMPAERGAFLSLEAVRRWLFDELTALTRDRLLEVGAPLLDSLVPEAWSRRLDDLVELLLDRGIDPSDAEIADWAEGIASQLHATHAKPALWAQFYDDLAAVLVDAAALAGRTIIVDNDGELRPAGGNERSRKAVPFFSPQADAGDELESETDLSPPNALHNRLFFVDERIPWLARDGQRRAKRPGRVMLETNGLVEEYRATEVLRLVRRAIANSKSQTLYSEVLQWIERFASSREAPPWAEITDVGLVVPTASGWKPAADTLFSTGWQSEHAEALSTFIDRAAPVSDEVSALRSQLVLDPAKWPYKVKDLEASRVFLSRIGVRDGLHPVDAIPQLSAEGRYFLDGSATRVANLSEHATALWRAAVEGAAPPTLGPYTRYVSESPPYRIPGQEEFESFTGVAKAAFADLLIRGLGEWDESVLSFPIYRHNNRNERFRWPSPAAAFLKQECWLPVRSPGAPRGQLSFEKPAESWAWTVLDDQPPSVVPFLASRARTLASSSTTIQRRLGELGIRYWDEKASAPERIHVLTQAIVDGDGAIREADVLRSYREAWSDCLTPATQDPLEDSEDPLGILAMRRGRLVHVPPGPDGDRFYLNDVGPGRKLALIEASGAAVMGSDTENSRSLLIVLRRHFDSRPTLVSEAAVDVVVDGLPFEPGLGELLIDNERTWLLDVLAIALAESASSVRSAGPAAIDRARRAARRVRVLFCTSVNASVDGISVAVPSLGPRVLPIDDPDHPTIAIEAPSIDTGSDALLAMLPALAELVGRSDIGDALAHRVGQAVKATTSQDGIPPTRTIAEAFGISVDRVRELRHTEGARLDELWPVLVPVVAALDPLKGGELWDDHEAFGDTFEIATWLARDWKAPKLSPEDLVDWCLRLELDAVRSRAGISLEELNDAIRSIGPPFEILQDEEGLKQQFAYFKQLRHESILNRLRAAWVEEYRVGRPLDGYVSLRELEGLEIDPAWSDTYLEVPESTMDARVDSWFAMSGCPAAASTEVLQPVEDVRRVNRAFVLDSITRLQDLAGAWAAAHQVEDPGPPAAEEVADLAWSAGILDFDVLGEAQLVRWLALTDLWPPGLPTTFELHELGLTPADVASVRRAREAAQQAQTDERRSIDLDGVRLVVDDSTLLSIVDAARLSITPEFLQTSPEPLALQALVASGKQERDPDGERRQPGFTARERMSTARKEGVGLVGEVVALEWVKQQYPGTTDDAWVSGYRNRVLGDGRGSDSFGYDISVPWKKKVLLFEVKATTGDAYEFELTESEIRAAQSLRRNEQYYVLFVQQVLDRDRRRIQMLPNPLSPASLGRYRTIGSGLRLRFKPVEAILASANESNDMV